MFAPELDGVIQLATQEQVRALWMGEQGLEKRELPLLDALVNLHNALAKSIGLWTQLVGPGIAHLTPNLLNGLGACFALWQRFTASGSNSSLYPRPCSMRCTAAFTSV